MTARTSSTAGRVTIEPAIIGSQAEEFYRLYLAAFGPMRTKAAARQVLHRDEFFSEMTNPAISKYVVWDDHDRPAGLTTLTADLETVPWISPEYFAARHPEHAARHAIYYLGFTLMHPQHRSSRLLSLMLEAVITTLAADRAVCGYDVCAYNDRVLRFGANLEALLHRNADVTIEQVDKQTYYKATFS